MNADPNELAGRRIVEAAATSSTTLNLSGLGLRLLPDAVGELESLTSLNLSGNELTQLPKAIGRLSRLELLFLARNRFTILPPIIEQLSNLRELYISRNQLTTLSPVIGNLRSLTILHAVRNRLTQFPRDLSNLSNLQKLDLSRNRIETVPAEIAQCSQLELLSVRQNHIALLPDEIGSLGRLRSLGLRGNRLRSLPRTIGQLSRLESLTIQNNRLTHFPDEMCTLSKLRFLNVSRNSLGTLPDAIGGLRRLELLDLHECALTSLPKALGNLHRLEGLYLHNNPGLDLPAEVLGPSRSAVGSLRRPPSLPREILDYYFATRGVDGKPLREIKLIVVGRGAAGKTSLIKRLQGEPFDPNESETHGITIRALELACSDGPVQTRVWDFGGQHVLHAMHEFFLTARSLYLLVLGERDDLAERDAAYWFQLIRSYAGRAPVVVAINKSGGRIREMDRRSLEERYGPIVAWQPTECSSTDESVSGIEALRDSLTKATDAMEEVRRRFPSKWFAIKKSLGSMREPYLDYEQYAARCRELGESDPGKQEELAAWLHDLGVALNYGRDPRLHDTTVLRPDWLANGIYAILRANDPSHPRPLAPAGVITAEDLGSIYRAANELGMLDAAEYPAEKWPFLLRLMSLFQLSFPLDVGGKRQLVPALLPVEEPEAASEPRGPEVIRLRYEFSVVPAPLIPRFLVRSFGLVKRALHWRRGALLSYGPATAKVWSTQDERWVYLTSSAPRGSEEARRDLSTMLRNTLRSLFAEYTDLRVVEQFHWEDQWVPRAVLERLRIIAPDELFDDGEDSFEEEDV